MLKIGDTAPEFQLEDQQGSIQSLSNLVSAGSIVLYFYPADFTPVCTQEACAFRDVYDDLSDVSVQVVGISPQSSESHQRFATRYDLPFPLLCDRNKSAIRAYGVDGPMGFGVRRVTFLVDKSRHIVNRVVADLLVGSHLKLVRKVINEGPATDANS